MAPWGSCASEGALVEMKASRTSSRSSRQATVSPAGSSVGMSFMECTAISIWPAISASSISLVNRPLPPASDRGRSWMRSPVVLMAQISKPGAAAPCAEASRRSTSRACASASGEPRVPMRTLPACNGPSPGARRAFRKPALEATRVEIAPMQTSNQQRTCRRRFRAGRQSGEALVLGIETSCDETAAAVVLREVDGGGRILSNVIRAQWEQHRQFGGVVPEIAARAHVECLDQIIAQAHARGWRRAWPTSMRSPSPRGPG